MKSLKWLTKPPGVLIVALLLAGCAVESVSSQQRASREHAALPERSTCQSKRCRAFGTGNGTSASGNGQSAELKRGTRRYYR